MSSRVAMLATLRAHARAAVPLPEVPLFDLGLPERLPQFVAMLEKMGGRWIGDPAAEATGDDLDALLRRRFPDALAFCSAVPEVRGTVRIEAIGDARTLAGIDVGVVRAGFAVAETGSVWLSEAQYRLNPLGYLPQHLVVLLDPAEIVPNLHHAYARPEWREARYAVLTSGPSATADIEGVLIRGAQGVRSLTVIALGRASGPAEA
ncbi:LutC/YkgG family protein [Chitinimonas koreensis]|uniref:LutC/YkgG family protein n=1 Tax=Chitinimonas koreensis TaxID=356302 RepID=UPI00040F16E7|nr:LUD domain-containing protein [Chitinimonas koreensis]QNM98809.1 LUD domain-containing protein [Chitinimonas koreensis]